MTPEQVEELRAMSSVPSHGTDEMVSFRQTLHKNVANRKHTVLAGPPGTGKTKLVLDLVDDLRNAGKLGVFQMVQFHREYSYQDFIEGYAPSKDGFTPTKGAFLRFTDDILSRLSGSTESDKIDIFLIDEMNRADVSSVFGELLTLMDDPSRKEIVSPRSQMPIRLPESVVILGTMNTADKSIALLDFALRRRFSFMFIPPDYNGLTEWLTSYGFQFNDFTIEEYVQASRTLNKEISMHPLLGKGMMLGQALFVPKKRERTPFFLEEISDVVKEGVIPQLEAYIGFGAQQELDRLIGVDIRQKIESAAPISDRDVVGLVRVLANAKSAD